LASLKEPSQANNSVSSASESSEGEGREGAVRVLVVDEDEPRKDLVRSFLLRAKIPCLLTQSGEQALTVFEDRIVEI